MKGGNFNKTQALTPGRGIEEEVSSVSGGQTWGKIPQRKVEETVEPKGTEVGSMI